ncbi:diguanylate cyclase [Sinisalibacter aestuarii]|uniref:diguanylate cyclase n=1 Tax=Sinisalibacter aestuarii TaxID=2949426 RepID=A0ABQ5LUF1_9RHOB|nr:diguanylate cyclase [Sinisalibacter aestuarii]GKY88605.1 diguanylate cyclase response regulator [Sinisalibacter aestuarii]
MAGRILIADPTATSRIILKVGLNAARYRTLQAADGANALRIAREDRPELIILNAHLPDMTGAELCARLKADPRTRALPVLILAAQGNRADRLAALRAGANDYLAKPVDETALHALVRNLMRARAAFDELARRQDIVETMGFAESGPAFSRSPTVALIAPTPDTGLAWRRALGLALGARITPISREQALETGDGRDVPDAFVIAADIASHGDGLRLVSELRSRQPTRHAAIVIQDEANDVGTVPMALDLGANAVVPGTFDAEEMAARLERMLACKLEADALRERFVQRVDLAALDPLTGLFNRRYAEAYLARVAEEAVRTGQPFALMLLDLDRFKEINDTYGHRIGDEVLVETAQRLTANLRDFDLVARHGGEEFLVAMPATDLAAAAAAAERLRRVIGDHPVRVTGVDVPVTVSIGVTLCTGCDGKREMPQLIEEADHALYASKHDGRNLVTFARNAAA